MCLAFFIGTEEVLQPATYMFGIAGDALRLTFGRVAEERIQVRPGLPRRGRNRPRPGVGAWLEISAEIRVLLVLYHIGDRLTTAVGHAGIEEFAQAADMQIRMAHRTLGQPRQWQGLALE
jgi:hypothetical protein